MKTITLSEDEETSLLFSVLEGLICVREKLLTEENEKRREILEKHFDKLVSVQYKIQKG